MGGWGEGEQATRWYPQPAGGANLRDEGVSSSLDPKHFLVEPNW